MATTGPPANNYEPRYVPARADSPTVEAFDQAARDYVNDDRPPNTNRAYDSDWRTWGRYCTAFGISTTFATLGTLVGFVEWMETQQFAVSTAKRRLSGTRIALRRAGIELSASDEETLKQAIKNYRRRTAQRGTNRGRGQAPAITVKQIRSICNELPDTLAGTRDRTMLLIGFAIGARRSELANLMATDIELCPDGLCITVRWGKTGQREAVAGYGTHRRTCPVRAWADWLETSGVTSGPAFRRVTRHDTLIDRGLSAEAVGDALTRSANRCGIAGKITGHSLRAGMATESRRAGHDAVTIARQGGWSENSGSLYGYMRTVDRWADNALVGIGL